MAFLDNSGDIIIDAVLTDTGRFRLAKGDGSFKIEKFALSDDEIDYGLFIKNATGSAVVHIEETPILEAFTNNASSMKSKLITVPRDNILYMPVLMANDNGANESLHTGLSQYVVAVDETTEKLTNSKTNKFLHGENTKTGLSIRLDQGINNSAISPKYLIESDLLETQYIIEVDNRLGKIVSTKGTGARIAYVDDDNIASYILTLGTDKSFVSENTSTTETNEVISGPRGTMIEFAIQASLDLNSSNYLFTTLGSTTSGISGVTGTVKYIDTTVRVQGTTTGVSVDLPVRFIKS